MSIHSLPAIFVLILLDSFAAAQDLGQTAALKGEITAENGPRMSELVIELTDPDSHIGVYRTYANWDGSFEFRNVRTGRYLVRVTAQNGNLMAQDFVDVTPNGFPVTLRIRSAPVQRPASGVVSLRNLRNPPPKKALRAIAEAQRYSQSGNMAKALTKLHEAIGLHPGYAEAHNNLGACLIHERRFPEAVAELQETVRLDPRSLFGYMNLSYALLLLGRIDEGEAAARQAVELAPADPKAHYLLGNALAVKEAGRQEACTHLKLAAPKFPRARLLLAQIYRSRGQMDEAEAQLKQYKLEQ